MQIRNNHSDMIREGLRLLAARKFEQLHARAIELIKQNPKDPAPYYLLGEIAFEHANYQKADELFRRASEFGKDVSRFHAARAKLFTTLNQQNKARKAADEAATLQIDDAFVADTIGVAYSRTGFHEKAVPMFQRAVDLNSGPANFHYNLAASLQFSGEFARAESAYQTAIDKQPMLHRAWSSLVSLKKQTRQNNYLNELERAFETSKHDADARLHFGHAIAKTLEDFGEYEQSLTWLGKAKQDKRAALQYDFSIDDQIFNVARAQVPLLQESSTESEPAPIFIVGLPRTGTTLVDRILSSHPDVVSAGELNTFAGLIKRATNTPSNRVLDAETLRAAQNTDLKEIGEAYVTETRDLQRNANRMTDKMPLNFLYVGLIHSALPNARIVCLRRNAVDSCLSNYRQLFSTGFSYYNYSLSLRDTASYYIAFDKLMSHWRASVPEDRLLEICYEDIIFDQENQTRALLSFCGLDWNDACLRFHENAAPVSTASSVQVRQPLYSGSIGRWKKYGRSLDELRTALGPLASGH